jgi:AcrR family transcriptional regulator
MSDSSAQVDPRMQRTRIALQGALMTLMMKRRYSEIRVEDLLRASGVGRSTFYENFHGKDELLVSCMEQMTRTLSSLPFEDSSLASTTALLEHLWSVRGQIRSLLQGAPLRKLRQDLVAKVEIRLQRQAGPVAIPARLAACALADVVLSPVLAWLSGEAWCSAIDLANGIQRASRATLDGICRDTRGQALPTTE